MKKTIILILFQAFCYSQNINGIYESKFNSFVSQNDPSNNFTLKPQLNTVIIEIYDFPNVNGSLTTMYKDPNDGETLSLKYQVTGPKRIESTESGFYYFYPAKMYMNNIPTKTICTIAIHSKLDDLFIFYEEAKTRAIFQLK